MSEGRARSGVRLALEPLKPFRMNAPFAATRPALARRTFLRGTGVALTLPFLEAMRPVFGATAAASPARRMVCIETNMGILPQFFFPEQAGRD